MIEQKPAVQATSQMPSSKTAALFLTSFAAFFAAFMFSGLNVAIPAISQEFNADAIVMNWIITVFALFSAVFLVPFGRIADIVGIKKIFAYGTIVFTIASALSTFANSSTMLIVSRAIQGIGGAMTMTTAVAMVTAVFPLKERGRALGINVACVYIGGSIGPFLGGILTEHLSWRSIFLVNVPVGFIVLLLLFWRIKGEWCECKGERFDYVGSVVYALALIALIYGFSVVPEIIGLVLVLAGIVGLLIFVRWESRNKSPILNINIFLNNRAFLFSNLAALINYSAIFPVVFFLSLYLQYIKGLGPEQAGLSLVAQPVIQAILSPIAGRLSDRIEPRILVSLGMALTCLGVLSLVFLGNDTPTSMIIIALVALGAGFGFFSSPNSNAIMSSVTPKFYGIASATMSTMRAFAQTLSMGIAMIIMSSIIGRVVITSQYYPALLSSAKISFSIFTVFCFAGIFVSLSRGNVR